LTQEQVILEADMQFIKLLSKEPCLVDSLLGLENSDSQLPLSLIQTFQKQGELELKELISCCIQKEIAKKGNQKVLFRENGLSMEILTKYMMLQSRTFIEKILHNSLQPFCQVLQDIEINPLLCDKNVKQSELTERMKILSQTAQRILEKVTSSEEKIPKALRCIFALIQQKLHEYSQEDSIQLCGSLFFLRLVNPILLSCDNTKPDEKPSKRSLILLSKILQSAANGAPFDGSKEHFMMPFNEVITQNAERIQRFYETLCTSPEHEVISWKVENLELSASSVSILRNFLMKNVAEFVKNIPLKHLQRRQQLIFDFKVALLPREYSQWTVEQTCFWLEHVVELPEYKQLFNQHNVTGLALDDLTLQDLTNINITSLGHKKKILRQLQVLRSETSTSMDTIPAIRRDSAASAGSAESSPCTPPVVAKRTISSPNLVM